jgi:hypothetical protein
MTAEETIELARKEGVRLYIERDEVVWTGRRPSALLLANIKFNKAPLLHSLASALDEEDKELLRQAGLSPEEPKVASAIRLFEGKVRAVRKAGSKSWIQRKEK